MKGTHYRTVSCKGTDFLNVINHLLLCHLRADLLAKEPGHLLHLIRNRRIIRTQVCMAFSGLHDDEAVILRRKIKVDLLYLRGSRLQKINRNETAYRTGHLV